MDYSRKIVLEDGQEFYGYYFGSCADKVCEIVFNTSMTGYQEILSDPSYTGQAVVMTFPLIGNYGMADDDYEALVPTAGALIVREYNDHPSNFRSRKTLAHVMAEFEIPGISGVDTRMLTRSIRDHGSRKALLCSASLSGKDAMKMFSIMEIPRNTVASVSCKSPWIARSICEKYKIAAIDCGMKRNILRSFNEKGVTVHVFPWDAGADEIRSISPDGIFISNGPGDPADVPKTIRTIKNLLGTCPVFGICLGHQIISLAYGARVYKLKFGHRGGNHPVKNLKTGKIEITSQNHSYAVDPDSLRDTPLIVTHLNLLDHTVEGVSCERDQVFGVQYHPESAPGPRDSMYLFDLFIELMEKNKRLKLAHQD